MESAGLLTPAVIRESGYRYYDYDNLARIKTILELRSFGLVYDDMKEFFESSEDYTLVYDKLYEKKLALDALLDRAKLHLKPKKPDEFFLLNHKEICVFKKTYTVPSLVRPEVIEEISSETFLEAVNKKYPIDFNRPVSLQTDCLDYTSYRPVDPQNVDVMIPLRTIVDTPDTMVLPPSTIISVTFYKGFTSPSIFIDLKAYMDEHKLKQCGPLAATYEIGTYEESHFEKSDYLFCAIIPCKRYDE